MHWPNILRIVALLYGGAVVGIGFKVLAERAALWKEIRRIGERPWRDPAWRAVALLGFVNLLVMVYISSSLLTHWNNRLSWRWALALVIFSVKAKLLHDVRLVTQEQKRASANPG